MGNVKVHADDIEVQTMKYPGEIRTSEVLFRNIIEKSADGIIILNWEGTVHFVNPAAERLFNCKTEDFIGKPFRFPVTAGEIKVIEISGNAKERTVAEMRVVNIEWDGENGSLVSVRDITERKKTEDEFKRAKERLEVQAWGIKKAHNSISTLYKKLEQKNKELRKLDQLKSDFVSTVSHELRTPLSITKEGISIVLDKVVGDINEQQEKLLTVAKNNIDRLARIIDNLLNISKIEAGKLVLKKASIDIADLIKQVASSFNSKAKEKNLKLIVNIPEAEINVFADNDRIIQVFTNLLGNAIKFTENGYVEIYLEEKDNEVECSVSDTGIGISQEDLPKVFSKFQQFGRLPGPGEKGTGLGLSIVKGIVEMHKGRIWVKSNLGAGTKFTFTLPKHIPEVIFDEYVRNSIKASTRNDSKMSIILVSITGLDKPEQKQKDTEVHSILKDIEVTLNDNLHRDGKIITKDTGDIAVILPNCSKKSALAVQRRLKQALEEYFSQKALSQKIELSTGCATYPDEAGNAAELIKQALKNHKGVKKQ